MTVRIGVAGACGRMGRAIIQAVGEAPGAVLGGVWERPGVEGYGAPYAGGALVLESGPEALAGQLDVVIDFTAPDATSRHARWCAENGVGLVIGTTGFEAEHHAILDECASQIPMVQAPNMSVGVNVMLALVAEAARMLGDAYDLEIVEAHHKHKVDAPSGTALRLLDALKTVRTDAAERFERAGAIGARPQNEIGIQTLRGGDVVGEHTVFYYGAGERIEITHRATDRGIFARGAVRAALWAAGRPPGKYSMADVLGA